MKRGRRLALNVKAAEGGSVQVALLDDCDPLRGDQVRGVMSWGGKRDLSALIGKTVRLRMELSRCRLYSFRAGAE